MITARGELNDEKRMAVSHPCITYLSELSCAPAPHRWISTRLRFQVTLAGAHDDRRPLVPPQMLRSSAHAQSGDYSVRSSIYHHTAHDGNTHMGHARPLDRIACVERHRAHPPFHDRLFRNPCLRGLSQIT
jgi:hypothetical protein